jgi:hypothetical protein
MARCLRESGAMISRRREGIGKIHAVILEDRTANLVKHTMGLYFRFSLPPEEGTFIRLRSCYVLPVIITKGAL